MRQGCTPCTPQLPVCRLSACPQSVGRTNICFDEFLTSAKFSDAAFMGAAGADRFVLENVDGFAWQLRLRSRVRGRLLYCIAGCGQLQPAALNC